MHDLTVLLNNVASGDPDAAAHLLQLLYDDLHRLAARSLAAEAPGRRSSPPPWSMRRTCAWSAEPTSSPSAEVMRRILVERARSKRRPKQGGDWARPPLQEAELLAPEPREDILALDAALPDCIERAETGKL
jgi:hypothetical protein